MTNPPLKGLQHMREHKQLTQAKLAKAIGMSQSQFNKFENGLVRLDIYRAAILAKHLGCSIDNLL